MVQSHHWSPSHSHITVGSYVHEWINNRMVELKYAKDNLLLQMSSHVQFRWDRVDSSWSMIILNASWCMTAIEEWYHLFLLSCKDMSMSQYFIWHRVRNLSSAQRIHFKINSCQISDPDWSWPTLTSFTYMLQENVLKISILVACHIKLLKKDSYHDTPVCQKSTHSH